MAGEIELVVADGLDGQRLDRVVARALGISRAQAAALLESGAEVDGIAASPSDRVRAGQVIRCAAPEATPPLAAEPVDFAVLYEDPSMLVVDKPAGLVVHPGSGRRGGTLAAGLLHRHPELARVGPPGRAGLVHRLDKDTSGVLMVARTQECLEALSVMLRRREVTRIYMALVEGILDSDTGTIEAPIGPDPSRPTRRAVTLDGKPATTHYEVVRRYRNSRASLIEVRLDTGRTHQIRVHLAAIGHPVVGDFVYGATRRDLGASRTFLHAFRIELTHPMTGERLMVSSALPPDLANLLEGLS